MNTKIMEKFNYSNIGQWIFIATIGIAILFGSHSKNIAVNVALSGGIIYSSLSLIGLSKNQTVYFIPYEMPKTRSQGLKTFWAVSYIVIIAICILGIIHE